MRKKKRLSMKDRLAIRIKKTRPARLWVLLVISAVLMAGLLAMGMTVRSPAAAAAPEALTNSDVQLRLTMAGDISLDDNIRKLASRTSYADLFTGVSTYWSNSDAVVANVSGPVLQYDPENYTSRQQLMDDSLYVRPAALRGLLEAGITLPCFANEHIFNYGITGIQSTLNLLNEYGMDYLGITADSTQPYYRTITGAADATDPSARAYTVSVLGINDIIRSHSTVREDRPGVINSTVPSIYETVYLLSQSSDQVVIYLHFGESNSGIITEGQRELAHMLIDAGADIIVGSHSHMVQPVERYADGLIVYDLGELLSTEDYSISSDGVMMDLILDAEGTINVYLTPTHIVEGSPVISGDDLYGWRIRHILTSQLREEDYEITPEGLIRISLGNVEPEAPVAAVP